MLPEENDVTQESLPEEESVSTEETTQPQGEENEQQEQNILEQTQTLPEQGQSLGDVDEFGVPWKNRAMEYKRKFEDTTQQQKVILDKMDNFQTQKQQYSEADLLTFINSPDTEPSHRAWASQEIEKIRDEKLSKTVSSVFEKQQQQSQQASLKVQALQGVQSRYPEAFVRDANGRVIGWSNSPLTSKISQYMTNPDIANNPNGLMVAAALAYSDISLGKTNQNQTKQQQLKQQVRTLQKQTLVEGGKTQVNETNTTPLRQAVDRARSGTLKDATMAMKEIFKAKDNT